MTEPEKTQEHEAPGFPQAETEDYQYSDNSLSEGLRLYQSMYKAGNIPGTFVFAHNGDLESAVEKVRAFCKRNHIKHLHTLNFLIDLDGDSLTEQIKMRA